MSYPIFLALYPKKGFTSRQTGKRYGLLKQNELKAGALGTDVTDHYLLTETRDPAIVIFEAQYKSLRKEILERQSRRFYLTLGGALGVPSLSGFKFTDAISGEFLLLVPIVVVAISFLFIQEVMAISRVGKFIETVIESEFQRSFGWEHYLKNLRGTPKKIPRVVRATNSSFMWLMLTYFLLAWVLANGRFTGAHADVLQAIYNIFMGLLFVHWFFVVRPFLFHSAEGLKD